MSITLEVIKLRDVIKVTGLPRFIPNVSPPVLVLTGEDFRSADRVFISEVEVPDFVIVDSKTIYAQLPASITAIESVEVISSRFTRTAAASRIDFSIGNTPRASTGLEKLTQHFLMWLFRDPSTDIFAPGSGGGLLAIADRLATTSNVLQLRSSIARAFSVTTRQVVQAQTGLRIPARERLLDTEILSIVAAPTSDEIQVKFLLRSFADDAAEAAFVL